MLEQHLNTARNEINAALALVKSDPTPVVDSTPEA